MPLGNSITQGTSSGVIDNAFQVSYRMALWERVNSAWYEMDYVGSLNSGSAVFGDPDLADHEGHPGWTDYEIVNGRPSEPEKGKLKDWLIDHQPDIVLLHIGTNGLSTSPDDVENILNEIDLYSQDVWVILARIINRSCITDNPPCLNSTKTTTFNDNVVAMAQARIETSQDKIIIVDMEQGAGIDYRLQPAGDMWDSLHPYETGYSKMADVWFFDGLQGVLPYVHGTEAVLDRIEIEGPLSVNENSSAQYNCRAYYSDGSDRLVRADTWQVDPTTYAQISATGLLSTEEVGSDEQVQISVSYTEGSISENAVFNVTIKDFVAPTEVIVDNGGPGTSFTGTWVPSSGADYYGSLSVYSIRDASATYTFTADVSGYHVVYLRWTWYSGSSNRCSNVQVDIFDGNILLHTIYVDQANQSLGGIWNLLGTYFFNGTARVVIHGQGSGCSTSVDGLQLVETNQPGAPVANFFATPTSGGAPLTVQFNDQSIGFISARLWDFGDGHTSTEQNPSHEYTIPGTYTTSLTVTNLSGSHTETKAGYIQIKPLGENIYLCDGYIQTSRFIPDTVEMLRNLGAREEGGVWIYRNNDENITYYIHTVRTPEEMLQALKVEGSHIIINAHANYGSGLLFASPEEVDRQVIEDIYFIDDDRFTNFSTDMVSLKVHGMQYGQAYPNWKPIYKDGTSGIMPYDFSDGLPPYNYYLTYTLAGDSTTYRIELSDGSYLERFPDSSTPAWYSPDGSPPDPLENPEYFITNPDPDFNRCDFVGDWRFSKEGDGYVEYNYHYHNPGSGANTATWNLFVKYPGYYSVVATWAANSSNATNATYTIQHANGSSSVSVNQRTTEGTNQLGEYYFEEGSWVVQLSDNANGRVVADAVSLLPLDDPEKILQAEFSTDISSGQAPLSVQFSDLSEIYSGVEGSENITARYWDFGDGTHSSLQNPAHTYLVPGNYTVSLVVTDTSGAEATEIKTNFIVVGVEPNVQAEFSAHGRIGYGRTGVNFIDQSLGNITSWNWDFGDGNYSNKKNPTHVYTTPGTYEVSLTVSGSDGNDTETKQHYVYNLLDPVYCDNLYQYKPHFYSRRLGRYRASAKVVIDKQNIKIPAEDMRYSRMFYGSCNTCNYYAGTLNRGILFCTTDTHYTKNSVLYLELYLKGYSDTQIRNRLNAPYSFPLHEVIDFNLKPPSLR